jgi:DNA-binding NarL/FixJ family response regulator
MLAPERRDRLVRAGQQYMNNDGEVRARMATLTPREREVLDAMIRGEAAHDMAEHFVVSVGTVRSHIASVLAKLGVSSQLAAAAVAVQWAASKRGLDHEDLLASLRPSA